MSDNKSVDTNSRKSFESIDIHNNSGSSVSEAKANKHIRRPFRIFSDQYSINQQIKGPESEIKTH